MDVNYYAVLMKAVAGKDAVARDQIYRDAYGLIRKSHLTREAASSHAAALEDAIRRIEDEFAAEDARSAEEINKVLASSDRNWMPLIVGCPNVGVWARTAIGMNSSKPPSSSLNRSFIGSPRVGRVLIVDDAAPVLCRSSQERRGADHCQLSCEGRCDWGSLPFLAEQRGGGSVQFPTRDKFDSTRSA